MIEKEIKIKTRDGHTIYGVLSDQKVQPSKTLVVFVHGLASSMHEHKYYNAARLFAREEIATFRFNFYDCRKGGRSIMDCTLPLHAADLNRVVTNFREKYKKIFLVGHSLGAIVILLADTKKVDGVIFWDGTHKETKRAKLFTHKAFIWAKPLRAYIANWGSVYVIPKALLDPTSRRLLIKNISCPIKLIYAEKGILVEGAKDYFKLANSPKELVFIKDADHNFDRGETAVTLHKETLAFVKKYSR